MAPNLLTNSGLLYAEQNSAEPVQIISRPTPTDYSYQKTTKVVKKTREPQYKWSIVWRNVFIFIFLHAAGLYGAYLVLFKCLWSTVIFTYFYSLWAAYGITAGAHRLWAHRTYKANLPLRTFLMLAQSAALQNHIYEWVRDHRVHHKFTDSDADPHNAKRGFFFSHMGWLMLKKHKDVIEKGKTVSMDDVYADPLVRFQMKVYVPLVVVLTFVLPTFVPWYYFDENIFTSFYVCLFRYSLSLNGTWLVNSAAHIWGMKPYDKTMKSTENKFVSAIAVGEGWHNYHHVFPWDYKAAELGNYRLNFTTAFLDLMAKIGWATELKTASEDMIRKRVARTGDGSWTFKGYSSVDDNNNNNNNEQGEEEDHHHGDQLWGWGDADMNTKEKEEVKLYNKIVD